jgi:hypothetical protein
MVPEMDCPAQSPDLNPTDHPWDELECRLHSRLQRPTSLTALAIALQEEWSAIMPETFIHLVESLPSRVRAVIKAKGGPPGINVHDWEVCHRESQITVLSGCPDTFDQIVYIATVATILMNARIILLKNFMTTFPHPPMYMPFKHEHCS